MVATKPGCAPLKSAYEQAVHAGPKTWGEVETAFLEAMESFDQNIATGVADMGDLQNGKGDFFNDLLALILENCAAVTLFSRGGVPGLSFPKHNLDVTFPNTGVVEFLLEAKAVGTPKHPGSPKQKAIGRPGSADLDKRIRDWFQDHRSQGGIRSNHGGSGQKPNAHRWRSDSVAPFGEASGLRLHRCPSDQRQGSRARYQFR